LDGAPEDEVRAEDGAGAEEEGDMPPMKQPLDIVLPTLEEVRDLKVVTREFEGGGGKFEALHNASLSRSLMSGTFEHVSSTGGVTRYEGTFLNNPDSERPTPHGAGVRTNTDGSTHSGQWRDGVPDGHGEWVAAPPLCESFVGEWKKGKKHGFGIQKFANGDMYEGDWANGKFHDRGKYVYANGDEFLGIWENGVKKHGSFYFKDGRVSRRTWDQGRLVTCQEYDSKKRSYLPTITHAQVHDPETTAYGSKNNQFGMVSPHGVRVT